MRGWWCTYSVLSLGTVGQPYLRERTNKDRGKLLGIESEGGSSERIPTWVLWTVEKISKS